MSIIRRARGGEGRAAEAYFQRDESFGRSLTESVCTWTDGRPALRLVGSCLARAGQDSLGLGFKKSPTCSIPVYFANVLCIFPFPHSFSSFIRLVSLRRSVIFRLLFYSDPFSRLFFSIFDDFCFISSGRR